MSPATGAVEPAAPGGLFSGYRPPPGGYDEPTLSGKLRETWRPLAERLEGLGASGVAQRSEQARRLLRDNGVTYNVYGAPQGPDRPWELDPIPLVIEKAEWQRLSSGLVQRASLLNAILADVYGPRQLLDRGLLPPKLLFGHPGFLLPCQGLPVPRQIYLHLYAAHLARGAGGEWVVLADRTQGPSGAGYAIENRLITSRLLPEDFHTLFVERLAPFFIALRETLESLAPGHSDNPRVVLLSPGPQSATYFEDAYLARYLGYALVEGGDLTVRGESVFLKTLGGLLPVDVVLRRVPDEESDPLELRAGSELGVAGLVQAARGGRVVVANALGSGFLEAPALAAFLPGICQALFGETLELPSIPTWWCGQPEGLDYVESHLHELIVRPAFLHRAAPPVFGWQLSQSQRQELLGRLRQRPGAYVGQARVERSTAPVWNSGRLEPWHVGLRAFTVASAGSYVVMPGGLSRVSAGDKLLGESVSAGESSKDVWVLSDGPVANVTLLRPPRATVQLRRSVNDLPSRVADHLFWLGRHVERAEGKLRHVRSAVVRMTNDVAPSGLADVALLFEALTGLALPDDGADASGAEADGGEEYERLRRALLAYLFADDHPGGLQETLQSLRFAAAVVRDRLSIDSWRIVNQLDLAILFPWPPEKAKLGDVLLLLNQLLTLLSAFSGLGSESMTRGPGWRFLDMGRRIERGLHTLRLLGKVLAGPRGEQTPLLEAVLEIADSSMTYRYRYLASLQLAPVLDLVLVDETNPRAVGFQLGALAEHLRKLPGMEKGERKREQRTVMQAQAMLRLCDVDDFCWPGGAAARRNLGEFVEQLAEHLRQLSDEVTERYLIHAAPSRRLGLFVEAGAGI